MPFITNSNAHNILREIDYKNLNLEGSLYKTNIDFFNKLEIKFLLAIKAFFENSDEFFKQKYEKHIRTPDTYSLVYEYDGASPAYHKNIACLKLLSDYKNYDIPVQIQNKGKEIILEYRKWFKEKGEYLLENDSQRFIDQLSLYFKAGISSSELKFLKKEGKNSGPIEIENINLNTLESDIDNLIKRADGFMVENEKNKIILNRYAKQSYEWKNTELLLNNNTGYSDKEVRDLLKPFENDFKKPLKKKLECYYRTIFNPKIELKEDLLNQLGFVPCLECEYYNDKDKPILPFNISDFLK